MKRNRISTPVHRNHRNQHYIKHQNRLCVKTTKNTATKTANLDARKTAKNSAFFVIYHAGQVCGGHGRLNIFTPRWWQCLGVIDIAHETEITRGLARMIVGSESEPSTWPSCRAFRTWQHVILQNSFRHSGFLCGSHANVRGDLKSITLHYEENLAYLRSCVRHSYIPIL